MGRRPKEGPGGQVHGLLVVDKPTGLTSHDIVSRLRRVYKTRRIGHAGTLDPMATGVLVVLFGEATKLSSVLTTQSKEYVTRVSFGIGTDSLDADGAIIARKDLSPGWLDDTALAAALQAERERTLQLPPAISAIKVDGERAYQRARRGEVPDIPPRDVRVHDLEVIARGDTWLELRLRVSKGYYVRALGRDLGQSLGAPAHLTMLRRTMSGQFDLREACGWPLEGPAPLVSLAATARIALPTLSVNEEQALRLAQGKRLSPDEVLAQDHSLEPREDVGVGFAPTSGVAAAFWGERLIALVEPDSQTGEIKVRRGINDPDSLPRQQTPD